MNSWFSFIQKVEQIYILTFYFKVYLFVLNKLTFPRAQRKSNYKIKVLSTKCELNSKENLKFPKNCLSFYHYI